MTVSWDVVGQHHRSAPSFWWPGRAKPLQYKLEYQQIQRHFIKEILSPRVDACEDVTGWLHFPLPNRQVITSAGLMSPQKSSHKRPNSSLLMFYISIHRLRSGISRRNSQSSLQSSGAPLCKIGSIPTLPGLRIFHSATARNRTSPDSISHTSILVQTLATNIQRVLMRM